MPFSPLPPVRTVTDQRLDTQTANRPLRVLFMATSPEDVKPLLNFEDEEGKILEATRNRPLELMVEESGSLEGLQYLIESFEPGYFDVFHLSGHADVSGGVPHFIMENDVGLRQDATAEEMAQAFAAMWPRLVFLSGCKTGQAPHQGGLPSLSEALVQAGAPAVLGWALPVGDTAASMLAAHLYASLATGRRIDEAVARARQHLFAQHNPNWHLLRLYANATPLDEVVTRPNTRGRQRIHYRSASQDFLDALGRSRVASRESFVGRRRQIQRCLKALRLSPSTDDVYHGLLLHGMGGLGKSTLAARLCERMNQTHQRAVWFGKVDETEILKLTSKVSFPDIELVKKANDILNQPDTGLQTRLEYLFRGPMATTSCLFVFDNFEDGNLDESARSGHVATPEALRILSAFLGAIDTTNADSRLIITSRYQFPLPPEGQVYAEGMESMRGAELEKKLQLLSSFRNDANTSKALRDRAIATAAGNPRLLEWLDRILADPETEHEVILRAMEEKTAEFREDVLAKTLLSSQTKALRQMLALAQIFDIPVPREAIQAVAGQERVTTYLDRAAALGLIEAGIDPTTRQTRYLVSKLLAPLLANDISDDERKAAYAQGATVLHRLWVLEGHDAN
jgi:CHAT domain/AAA ATPase domain